MMGQVRIRVLSPVQGHSRGEKWGCLEGLDFVQEKIWCQTQQSKPRNTSQNPAEEALEVLRSSCWCWFIVEVWCSGKVLSGCMGW